MNQPNALGFSVSSAAASSPTPCARELSAGDWLIFDLAVQSIRPNSKGEYFSEFIGSFARALRHSCKCGLMIPAPGYENVIDEEDRVFAARKATKYGVRPAHDPATCWWCQNPGPRKALESSGMQFSEKHGEHFGIPRAEYPGPFRDNPNEDSLTEHGGPMETKT